MPRWDAKTVVPEAWAIGKVSRSATALICQDVSSPLLCDLRVTAVKHGVTNPLYESSAEADAARIEQWYRTRVVLLIELADDCDACQKRDGKDSTFFCPMSLEETVPTSHLSYAAAPVGYGAQSEPRDRMSPLFIQHRQKRGDCELATKSPGVIKSFLCRGVAGSQRRTKVARYLFLGIKKCVALVCVKRRLEPIHWR